MSFKSIISAISLTVDSEVNEKQVKETGKDLVGKELDEANQASNYLQETQNFIVANDRKVPQAPFVTDTNKWTGLTIKRLMAKAEEEGYDSIAFSAGIIHANRWNNQGLKTYYDKVLPSVINKVVGKIDKSSIGKVTLVHSNYNENTGLKIYSDLDGFPQLAIRLTPKVKETVKKGQALFSAGGLVGASMLSSQGENSEVMNGNT